MVTKLKNWTFNPIVKLISFLLAIVCLIAGARTIANSSIAIDRTEQEFYRKIENNGFYFSYSGNYKIGSEAEYAQDILSSASSDILLVVAMKGETEIKNLGHFGRIVALSSTNGEGYFDYSDPNDIEDGIRNGHLSVTIAPPDEAIYVVVENDYSPIESTENEMVSARESIEADSTLVVSTDIENSDFIFDNYYSPVTEKVYYGKESAIDGELFTFKNALSSLEESGISYEIKLGDHVYQSGRMDHNYSYTYANHKGEWSQSIREDSLNPYRYYDNYQLLDNIDRVQNISIYIGTNAEQYPEIVQNQNAVRSAYRSLINKVSVIGFTGLICLIILTLGAGRKKETGRAVVHFNDSTDRIYLDVFLVLIALVSMIIIALQSSIIPLYIGTAERGRPTLSVIIALFPFTLLIIWYLSFVKRVKNKRWWTFTLISRFFHSLLTPFKRLVVATSQMPSKIWLIIGLGVTTLLIFFSAFPRLILLTLPIALVLVYLWYLGLGKIQNGISAIEKGEPPSPININHGGLSNMSRSVEHIAENMEDAVSNRLKSERLKTELITNVSHDLRTPLTSIITYTDLLKTKGLDSKEAPDYLDVLIQKSQRLKSLTDDLFEATKAASGNIDVTLEPLDWVQLIDQCMGELSEEIGKSSLDFVLNLPEHATVYADGKLLHRVLENLFSNIFKYSMKSSRVYMDLFEKDNQYVLEIKNMSAHPLNVSPDDLTQRFSRGDTSRSTEGSGLGLSIVESFMKNQKGRFTINIDGDLFKTIIGLDKAEEPSVK